MQSTVLGVLQTEADGGRPSHRSRSLVNIASPHFGERYIVENRERHCPGLLYIQSAQSPLRASINNFSNFWTTIRVMNDHVLACCG